MSIVVNGVTIPQSKGSIIVNGVQVEKVIANNVEVWKSSSPYTVSGGSALQAYGWTRVSSDGSHEFRSEGLYCTATSFYYEPGGYVQSREEALDANFNTNGCTRLTLTAISGQESADAWLINPQDNAPWSTRLLSGSTSGTSIWDVSGLSTVKIHVRAYAWGPVCTKSITLTSIAFS